MDNAAAIDFDAALTLDASPAPAPAVTPATDPRAEEDDPGRCPKRWMGKRCVLRVGHIGICRWD